MQKVPVLGELEQAVLEYIWKHGQGAVKTVHATLGRRRNISPNTIQSTLERLRKKGLLERKKVSRSFVYHPVLDRNELIGKWLNEVIDSFSAGKTEVMISAFADLTRTIDARDLVKLEELIKNAEKQR